MYYSLVELHRINYIKNSEVISSPSQVSACPETFKEIFQSAGGHKKSGSSKKQRKKWRAPKVKKIRKN